jgi:DNA-binding MarR family transcriptional regulator
MSVLTMRAAREWNGGSDAVTGTTDPAEVAELMVGCVKRMRRWIDDELSELGLSLSRAKILGALETVGPSNQSTLAVAFDLAPRTITELVDLLERDGLVERRTDPSDRRARQVSITPAGREAHDRAKATRSKMIRQVFGDLDENQLAELFTTLRRIDDKVLTGYGRSPGCESFTQL